MKYEAIVIGVSAGGLNALKTILPTLPHDFKIPVIIVQHEHASSDDFLAHYLNDRCMLTVIQADEKIKISSGNVYLAPPNYHLLVEDDKTFSLSIDEHVNYARPSIDVLFETASEAYGNKLIGIILTGANSDGSIGLKEIKKRGGLTIVQEPSKAEVATMPSAAISATQVDYILPLEEIGPFLCKLEENL
ncbi:MAG: chemotaxis protein CheB [Desulfobacterales bacterium]|nr:chemotaxis protein CheB [Desulfobacterales bacterium]MBF0397320.1 chemotaxis protein CheB [Desulfobacterales bacterium]